MKIEIDTGANGLTHINRPATIKIGGRTLVVKVTPNCAMLEGIESSDMHTTLGGIFAVEIYSLIASLARAEEFSAGRYGLTLDKVSPWRVMDTQRDLTKLNMFF